MRQKLSTRLAFLCCIVSAMVFPFVGHAQGAAKQVEKPTGAAYAKEESGVATPELAAQEVALRSQLERQPDSAEIRFALGRLLREEGKPHESLDMYTQAAAHRRPTAADLQSVALDYVLLNDYDDAIHWLEVATQMEPTNADVRYSLGRCYYTKGRYVDAGREFEKVLAIQPKHLKAEENLGLAYDATNQPRKAEDALRQAANWANENGTDEWPFFDLGSFLLSVDRSKDAVDPLRIAARIQPGCAACHEKLGRALVATGDSNAGLAELERGTELDPKNPKLHYELGQALRQAGQTDRGRAELSLSEKLYGEHSSE